MWFYSLVRRPRGRLWMVDQWGIPCPLVYSLERTHIIANGSDAPQSQSSMEHNMRHG